MTADESGRLSGLSGQTEPQSSGSASPVGVSLQPIEPPKVSTEQDINERPIGRCWSERFDLQNAMSAVRSADARLQASLTAYWACRDAAAATAGIQSPSNKAASFLATTFDGREDDLRQIEKLIEDDSKTF